VWNGLDAQAADVRNHGERGAPREWTREERAEEVAALLRTRAALEGQTGPEPHDTGFGPLELEAVEHRLDLRLVAA
jgi:hypothetical protein